jgi:hypothetical protein
MDWRNQMGKNYDTDAEREESPVTPLDIVGGRSPRFLFTEFTGVDKPFADAISAACLACDAIPLIDYDDSLDLWVFHSLVIDGQIYKKGCAASFTIRPDTSTERDFENKISESLNDRGIPHWRQTECLAGVADIATDNAVIEVKLNPGNSGWHTAIGQAIAYRYSLDVPLAAIVSVASTPTWVLRVCRSTGIRCFTERTLDMLADYLKEGAA